MGWPLALLLASVAASAAPVIVIDPGHGGSQSGASSPTGQLEKHLALELSKKLKSQLELDLGAKVLMTRTKDGHVPLPERVEVANRQKPDLFLSIHLNSMPTRSQRLVNDGVETYFLSASASGEQAKKVAARENAEVGARPKGGSSDTLGFILADLQRSEAHHDASMLAYAVHEALVAQTGATDRGVQQAPFFVLMGLEAPAVLVEVGFISHPAEGKRLADAEYQETVARAISAGVAKFLLKVQKRDLAAP